MPKTNKTLSQKTVMFTGGHAGTTALATLQAAKLMNKPWKFVWVGPAFAIEGSNTKTLEFKTFPSLGVTCVPITAGRLQRKLSKHTFSSLMRVPIGFVQAFSIVAKYRPFAIASFGGYAAFPVVVAGFIFRIPVVIHEQTSSVGLSNKLSSLFANKITVARSESLPFFPKRKTVLIGNPLMQSILTVKKKLKPSSLPSIYLTGGSRGSLVVNAAFKEGIEQILSTFRVTHQTGDTDYENFIKIKKQLPKALQDRYEVINFTDPLQVHKQYERADIVIGRSGANTVSEIMAVGRPAIFIPIPWTRNDEQNKNAFLAQNLGLAEVLSQDELNGESLYKIALKVYKNYSRYIKKNLPAQVELDKTASQSLVETITLL